MPVIRCRLWTEVTKLKRDTRVTTIREEVFRHRPTSALLRHSGTERSLQKGPPFYADQPSRLVHSNVLERSLREQIRGGSDATSLASAFAFMSPAMHDVIPRFAAVSVASTQPEARSGSAVEGISNSDLEDYSD